MASPLVPLFLVPPSHPQVDVAAPPAQADPFVTHPLPGGRGDGVPWPWVSRPWHSSADPTAPGSGARAAPAASCPPERGEASALDLLSELSCWSHLRSCGEGVLHYPTGHGAVGLAVPYVVEFDEAVVSVVDFNEACRCVPGAEVQLEISGRTGPHDRWLVRLTATGRLERPSATSASVQLRLTPRRVRGYAATDVAC